MTMILSRYIYALLIADLLVIGIIFSVSGVYNLNVDAKDYIEQIRQFVDPSVPGTAQLAVREFKPLYAWIGGLLVKLFAIDAATSIVLINIAFFLGLSFSFFWFLRLLNFEVSQAFVGSLWLISGYPMLKYGLSIGTDISGWFFATVSAAVGLYGIRSVKTLPLIAASILAFIGFLGKETGILGLGIVGFYVLFQFGHIPSGQLVRRLFWLSAPFIILEGLFLWYLHASGALNFFDWYRINADGIQSFQTLRYFTFIEAATFHVLIPLGLLGLLFAWHNKELFSRAWLARFVPLLLVALPMIAWPIYITRILYSQFLFVIPLALYGAGHLHTVIVRNPEYRVLGSIILTIVPIAVSLALYIVGHDKSLFDLLLL